MLLRLVLTLLALATTSAAQGQFNSSDPMVDVSLVADLTSVEPGETVYIALHQEITPGWHTYWRNPGDSGEATMVDLALPEGWAQGDIIWPAPKAYALGPLTNYGYSDQVTLPIPVTVPIDAQPGPVSLDATANWLVCEDICIPESATLQLSLNVGPRQVEPLGSALIERAIDAAPQRVDDRFQAGLVRSEDGLTLTLTGDALGTSADQIRDLYFYPHTSGIIDHAAQQRVSYGDGQVRVDVDNGYLTRNGLEGPTDGVVVFQANTGGIWATTALEFTAAAGATVNDLEAETPIEPPDVELPDFDVTPATPAAAMGFVQAALFALLGGLLLNLMPCVFPILSMKALTLVEKRGASRSDAIQLGLIFAAGVIGTFILLGAAILLLRVAGLPGLWGVQLQVPVIVISLALLMFLIGLNFLGLFEVGTSLQSVGSGVKDSGKRGAFLTGVLAVFVAAPCLAPFMTGALAFALSQPAILSLAIFGFLGVGLALPFVLVTVIPGAMAFLPKPGAWMVRFRQILAFPMFATAIWLTWVLVSQVGNTGVILALTAFLSAGFAVWTLAIKGLLARIGTVFGIAVAAGAILLTAQIEPVESSAPASARWAQWSEEAVATAQAEGRAVFVDFTASWCVSCQINKLGTLNDADVKTVFDTENVALFRADFTNHDPVIAEALARHGSAGVPLYLVYPAGGGAPEVLPPLLTKKIVIQSVERAVEA